MSTDLQHLVEYVLVNRKRKQSGLSSGEHHDYGQGEL